MHAVILFGHGSRDALWRRPIEAVAQVLAVQAPEVAVRCAYLEFDTPGLPAAAAELAGLGARSVAIVPMFLGTGRHAREDLPALVEAARAAHPGVAFTLKIAVGEDPRLTDLLAKMALE